MVNPKHIVEKYKNREKGDEIDNCIKTLNDHTLPDEITVEFSNKIIRIKKPSQEIFDYLNQETKKGNLERDFEHIDLREGLKW